MEAQFFKDMREDTCDLNHTTDQFDLSLNDATGPSSNCPSDYVNIHDEVDVSILQFELRHVLDSMVDDHEKIPMEHFVVPFVLVDGSKIFKSTLVNQLNGNPTLSKDRMTRIKYGMLYTKLEKIISSAGDNGFCH